MDPISMLITGGLTVASMAFQLTGGAKASAAASQQAGLSAQNAGLEMQVDEQRRQAMELDAKRKQMEVLRNAQRARSLALDRSTNQGAQFGSALGGSYGQISGQTETNLLGISQDLSIGRNIFGLNEQIDQNKIQMAQLGGNIATGEGMMTFGKGLAGAISPLSNLFGLANKSSSPNAIGGFAGGLGGISG